MNSFKISLLTLFHINSIGFIYEPIKSFKRNFLFNVIDFRSPHKYKDKFINVNNLCEDYNFQLLLYSAKLTDSEYKLTGSEYLSITPI